MIYSFVDGISKFDSIGESKTSMETEMNRSKKNDPRHWNKVKASCGVQGKGAVPTDEMTVGDRTYEILGFLREGETSVVGHTMVERAKDMGTHLGENDGAHLLRHKDQIPTSLVYKMGFVFPDWHHPNDPASICCITYTDDDGWGKRRGFRNHEWDGFYRLLRRK